MIKYSVVIPMYNNENTIKKAIQSVVNQTRYDLVDEIIIIDDGSIDKSSNVVETIIGLGNYKIKLINKSNGGAASARNLGIRLAKNNYVALLDADDEWLPNKLEIQNSIIENHPYIHALGSNRVGEIIKHGENINDSIYKISPFDYCVKNWPCTPSIIFEKMLFKNDEYFNESMTHAEEGVFFLDLAASNSGLYYTVEPLVFCGGGKPAYGYSGLSGNLKKMHEGVKMMHRIARKRGYISHFQNLMLNCYENIKYLRRIILTYIRKRG